MGKMMIQKTGKLILISFIAILSQSLYAEENAHSIIQKMDEKFRGKSSAITMTIIIERPRFQRTMQVESWEDSVKDKSFIRILKPDKDRGVTFLKDKTNLWQYVPSIAQEIKIEGSLMQDSWMGSDFSNDDLVKKTSIVDDFDHTMLTSDSLDTYKIAMVPKPSAAVVWSKIIVHVRKADLLPAREEYYDHQNRMKRLMEFSDFRTLGGKFLPAKTVMHSIEKDKVVSRTTMTYNKAQFDMPVADSVFSKANMRR